MHSQTPIKGFSKLNKEERIDFLIKEYQLDKNTVEFLQQFTSNNTHFQKLIDDLSENPISNYHMPFSVAPNFLVDGEIKTFPFVTEESSVVAALAKAAGFWADKGGFYAEIIGTEKKGQVHFKWEGNPEELQSNFKQLKTLLIKNAQAVTQKMDNRGGGITGINLSYLPEILDNYYQLNVSFETLDAMGANFINSVLENFATNLQSELGEQCEIIMSILSNYTPNSLVKVWVECPVTKLKGLDGIPLFPQKFVEAVKIAQADTSRAVTHNKGILNGIDAMAIATGNDFRAIEASVHAYAAKAGQYSSLSKAGISNNIFRFEMEIPLAVGVIGGITNVHPLAKLSLQILEQPSAKELMIYMAVAGLASNFSAVRALVTSGIQKGHMKMHLSNILNQLNIPEEERLNIQEHFAHKTVSYSEVENYWKRKLNAQSKI